MTIDELGKTLITVLSTLVPILTVLAVYKGFEYMSSRKVEKESEAIYSAIDRLWPHIDTRCLAEMVVNEPKAYTVLASHITARQLAGVAKGVKL